MAGRDLYLPGTYLSYLSMIPWILFGLERPDRLRCYSSLGT